MDKRYVIELGEAAACFTSRELLENEEIQKVDVGF